jgi:subtilisin family serine protease
MLEGAKMQTVSRFFGAIGCAIAVFSLENSRVFAQEAPNVVSTEISRIDPTSRLPLANALSDNGIARVIVTLKVPDNSAASGGSNGEESEAATRARMARVTAVRDRVVARHFGFAAVREESAAAQRHALRLMRITPMFAADVDRTRLNALAQDPDVETVSLDSLSGPQLTVSTRAIGMSGDSGAWAVGATGRSAGPWPLGIAIIDSGVRTGHPMLLGRLPERDMCFSTTSKAAKITSRCPFKFGVGAAEDCNPNSAAGCGHGTHVAGIAAGSRFTHTFGMVLRGVASEAKIQAVNVFGLVRDQQSCQASNLTAPCILTLASDQVAALEEIYTNRNIRDIVQPIRIRVINMSLGGGQTATACNNDARAPIIRLLRQAGIMTVVAAGNNSSINMISAPACIPETIAVGNATARFNTAGVRIISVSASSNNGNLVDLMAPGQNIRSAGYDRTGPNRVAIMSGTSMAAPHVAGAILAIQAKLSVEGLLMNPNGVEQALKQTGTPLFDQRPLGLVTKPFINVDRALSQMLSEKILVAGMQALRFSGREGGPFTNTGGQLSLSTLTPGPTRFNVVARPSWLNVTPSSFFGTLPNNFTFAMVPNVSASSLPPGVYRGTVTLSQSKIDQRIARPVVLTVNRAARPSNDFFSNSELISVSTGVPLNINGLNTGATLETGEFSHRNGARGSVWYRYVPSVSGRLTVSVQRDMSTPAYKPRIAVYQGNAVNALTHVVTDLTNSDVKSEVSLHVTAGIPLHIMVGGKPEGSYFSFGRFIMRVTQTESLMQVVPGVLGYGKRVGEISQPTYGELNISSPTGETFFQITQVPNWAEVSMISGVVPINGSVPVRVTIKQSADTLPLGATGGMIKIMSGAGQAINIPIYLTMYGSSSPPVNDNYSNPVGIAVPIPGAATTVIGSNTHATREIDEPRAPASQGNQSVWWVFTPTETGPYSVETLGSSFDTTLAVYTRILRNFILVADNDDSNGTQQSDTGIFFATAGVKYYIAVDGYLFSGATRQGSIQLTLRNRQLR